MQQRVVYGHPARVLLGAAGAADQLVVGSRGHGGFAGMLLGSASQHLIPHAPCPITVIGDTTGAEGPSAPDGRGATGDLVSTPESA